MISALFFDVCSQSRNLTSEPSRLTVQQMRASTGFYVLSRMIIHILHAGGRNPSGSDRPHQWPIRIYAMQCLWFHILVS
ncbi:unnamed protein product [Amoebophrya sp. A25]|nr:unnamed protein product [Amoebophrya sp. A25]|eukprot:GSA25T00024121001.1